MSQTNFSSSSNSSDFTSRSFSSASGPPYSKELDIPSTSNSGASSSTNGNGRPLMPYSFPFSSNWQKDYGTSSGSQGRTWSTQGNSGRRS
ncbi:hypothetical protein F4825DRAFT_199546 [Nemania diffusa]|nr:hypothetical protein F4825DRAFT_199546 [Nemania diffusa]